MKFSILAGVLGALIFSAATLPAQTSSLQAIGGGDGNSGGGKEPKKKGKTVEFHVSQTGTDKAELMRAFKAVQKSELEKNEDHSKPKSVVEQYVVDQRISSHEFLLHPRNATDTRLWLITKRDRKAVDGDVITVRTVRTGNIREYVSVLGAKKSVREIEEVEKEKVDKSEFTHDDFLAALKDGKTWTLKSFLETKCEKCFGTGNLGAAHDYKKCPHCEGKGLVKSDCVVAW
jgi:hypothetical protein